MSAVITLLTDFGISDSYVGEMKAVLLSRTPEVTIVDITHEIALGDVRTGAYLLSRFWHRFPPGTIHLCVIDPGVGTERRALAIRAAGHLFVGPDNGVLTPAIQADESAEVVELHIPTGAAPTFHGRDVFAPVAARLAEGEALGYLGESAIKPTRLNLARATRKGDTMRGEVIHIDRFGTLVTNIPGDGILDSGVVELPGGVEVSVKTTFADVDSGAPVAFVGSGGTLEIALRDGRAIDALESEVGTKVVVRGVRDETD